MTPEIKQAWITALRSGEYQQGITALEANGRYCCLGVLVKVLPDAEIDPASDGLVLGAVRVGDLFAEVGTEAFSDEQCTKLGMDPTVQELLIKMNDDDWEDFSAIADWIEGHDLRALAPVPERYCADDED